MPTDNVVLNAGTGGSTVRTLADASSNEWAASVCCYATTVSPGANVLQVVTASAGLPVAQQGAWTVGVSGTVPVSGTFWQGTQPVSGTITANAGSGTLAVSAASLPLPTGAAADSSVSGILVSQGSSTSGEKGPLVQGAVYSGTPSYTNAQTSPLTLDTSGNLRVNVTAGGGSGGTSSTIGAAYPGTATAAGAKSSGGNLAAFNLDSSGYLYVNVAAGGAGGGIVTQATAANLNATVVGTGTFAVQAACTGTVTANAGTNTSTAALALETGGNLATLAGTVSSGKVIVGQGTAANLLCTASQGGTWNVGTVTTVTTVSALTSITNALPAGTNLLGSVAEAPQVGLCMNGTTSINAQYYTFTLSSPGTTANAIAASSGKKIYVLRYSVRANGAATFNMQSHTTTALATGICYMTQYSTAGGAYCPVGIFATASGEGLDIVFGGTGPISGEITYAQF